MGILGETKCQVHWEGNDPENGISGSDAIALSADVYDDGFTMPDGSLEALARSADLTGQPSTAAALRHLLANEDLPAIDRLYLAPEIPIQTMRMTSKANCLEVFSVYVLDDEAQERIEVRQRLRCPTPAESAALPVIGVVDDVWDVRVAGPRGLVDPFVVDHLQLRYLATVEPFDADAGVYDANAAADAEIAWRGWNEIARFPWNNGVVAVVVEDDESSWGRYEARVFVPDGSWGGGGGGMACRTHTTMNFHDGIRGYAVAIAELPGLRIVVRSDEMEPRDLPLEPVGGGREAALVDLEGLTSTYFLTFTAFDAEGVDLGCDQTPDP